MSVFRNIRIMPTHGDRSAVITWSIAEGVLHGQVFVAYSPTGLPKTWTVKGDSVASEVGMFHDTDLVLNSSSETGYYQLQLRNSLGRTLSEKVGIIGDLTPLEYGMVRSIMHREFTEMRATNGYPVWHCIPKSSGPLAPNVDPDTLQIVSPECADAEDPSYGMLYQGGFHPPILTWIRPGVVKRGSKKDPADGYGWQEANRTQARMMAYPAPSCEHMIVDPATDRRYLVGQDVNPFLLRGVMPVAYEVELHELATNDARYRFPIPDTDMKEYRRLPYWSIATNKKPATVDDQLLLGGAPLLLDGSLLTFAF